MDKRDLVIGAITGYNFNQIAPWVNSLDRSGFTGIKAVVAYNISYDTAEELSKRGYAVLAFQKDDLSKQFTYPNKDFSVVVDRFLHYYLMLHNQDNAKAIRYVIATDVKDVIFQLNPSDYLTSASFEQRGIDIIASSEGLQYQHEAWGANNLRNAFGPIMYEQHKENTIVNCGVIAGDFDVFLGLAKSIWLMCANGQQHIPGGGGPDQAALNLLLSTAAYRSITEVQTHAQPWACQLGTTLDPNKIDTLRPHITEPLPEFVVDRGLVYAPNGKPYAIVHQYDRVPEIAQVFERLYR